ncbi:hypothetical protein ACFX13_039928 [Malus domestica]|uniref:Flavonoid 3'-monooxygenase n=2 Tax=Malus domestica TaxID=3750 RepID=A0A498JTE1_MALDO|nr:hypothetical protein DVH24_008935 [Malus domestica]
MFVLIFFTVVLAFFLYRLFAPGGSRHAQPLPPGPKPWPVVGNLPHLGPVPHHSLAALARQYGPLMHLRLGFVDVVVAASASVASQFLKTHDANFSSRPPNSGAKHLAYNYQDLVFAPYGPRWRMLRKISSVHLFSGKALDDLKHVRQEEVGVLAHGLASAGSKPVNLGQLLNVCTVNALGRVMVGRRLFGDGGGREDQKADEFKSMVVEMMVLAGVFNIGDFIPALEWLDLQGVAGKMKKLHKRFDAFLTAIVEDHKRSGEGKHVDMLTTLLSLTDDADGEGAKLTDTEIKALLLNMFTAGTDTSSSTVEWAIAELLRHPKILAQLQQELDQVAGRDRLITESDLPNLTYLQAVIKETFRLHPSTPLSLPRMASESCEINGFHIPKGATLLVNVWAISRDPAQWSEPLEFRPERFLPGGEKPNVDVKGNDFEVIPFGAGRRICAGMTLGLRMVSLMTATLVHGFDWTLADGLTPEKLNMDEAYGLTLQRAAPLMVHPPMATNLREHFNKPVNSPIPSHPATIGGQDQSLSVVISPECHGFWYDAVLVVPAVVFVVYLAFQAKKNVIKLSNGRSYIMISYYALLWVASLLNLAWCALQAWQCSGGKEVAWNVLSLFTGSAMLGLEISLVGFLLQEDYASGVEALAHTFLVSGIVVGVDILLKVIYVFGFGVPLFTVGIGSTYGVKWGLWLIHKLLLTAVYGFILFVHFSKWREKLPPRPAFYNYIVIMFVLSALASFGCGLAGIGAGFGIWLYNLTDICYHTLYLPFLYVIFLADFFQEESFLLENAYYSEMKDAGFFDADWD